LNTVKLSRARSTHVSSRGFNANAITGAASLSMTQVSFLVGFKAAVTRRQERRRVWVRRCVRLTMDTCSPTKASRWP